MQGKTTLKNVLGTPPGILWFAHGSLKLSEMNSSKGQASIDGKWWCIAHNARA
jgi:hypothetical protein